MHWLVHDDAHPFRDGVDPPDGVRPAAAAAERQVGEPRQPPSASAWHAFHRCQVMPGGASTAPTSEPSHVCAASDPTRADRPIRRTALAEARITDSVMARPDGPIAAHRGFVPASVDAGCVMARPADPSRYSHRRRLGPSADARVVVPHKSALRVASLSGSSLGYNPGSAGSARSTISANVTSKHVVSVAGIGEPVVRRPASRGMIRVCPTSRNWSRDCSATCGTLACQAEERISRWFENPDPDTLRLRAHDVDCRGAWPGRRCRVASRPAATRTVGCVEGGGHGMLSFWVDARPSRHNLGRPQRPRRPGYARRVFERIRGYQDGRQMLVAAQQPPCIADSFEWALEPALRPGWHSR